MSLPTINWEEIRAEPKSKNQAFEELVCQIACNCPPSKNAKYIRKGAPDSGVECYYILEDGSEVVYQAKYFCRSPVDWSQITESIKKAISGHPKLSKFIVFCPLNLPDERTERKSARDQWNSKVQEWTELCHQLGRTVSFEYMGDTELRKELLKECNAGILRYYFDRELFTHDWFRSHIERQIANAGPRYSPELNVELPINSLFDSLGRNDRSNKRLIGSINRCIRTISNLPDEELNRLFINGWETKRNQLIENLNAFRALSNFHNVSPDLEQLFENFNNLFYFSKECRNFFRTEFEKVKQSLGEKYTSPYTSEFTSLNHFHRVANDFESELYQLNEYLNDIEGQLMASPFLIIHGKAGFGKTHLLCDIAHKRIQENAPTILLFGGHYSKDEFWTQSFQHLELSFTKSDVFLGALQSKAIEAGECALIFIDALNEGEARFFWKEILPGIFSQIKKYPYVRFVVTVRDSYLEEVIPKSLSELSFQYQHEGFTAHEYKACSHFFNYYKLNTPGVPMLHPEFSSPLFLKLLCEGLIARGLKSIPSGLEGLTGIFHFYLDAINEKLAKKEFLDYNPGQKYVHVVLNLIAAKMAEQNSSFLLPNTVESICNKVITTGRYENSLYKHLFSESILSLDMDYSTSTPREVVRFSYERFADIVKAIHLLNVNVVKRQKSLLVKAIRFFNERLGFRKITGYNFYRSCLNTIFQTEEDFYLNRRLVETFCILFPEQFQIEFPQVFANYSNLRIFKEAFTNSLIWRNEATLKQQNIGFIETYLRGDASFLEQILMIAGKPEHPFNADYIHRRLWEREMHARDASWSMFLFHEYGNRTAIDRILNWSLEISDPSHIDEKSMILTGTILTWYLTTSHRFVRDKATKALVNLFQDRISLLPNLLDKFKDVNDPYISERLMAVAYGCAMRSSDNDGISQLAQTVYDLVFANGKPYPHILFRDYARGIVELSLSRGLKIEGDIKRINPPYLSEDLENVPTWEVLEKNPNWLESPKEAWRGFHFIKASVKADTIGDFGIYILSPAVQSFSPQKLGTAKQRTPKDAYDELIQRLDDSLTDELMELFRTLNLYKGVLAFGIKSFPELVEKGFTDEQAKKESDYFIENFRKKLPPEQIDIFNEALEYLRDQSVQFKYDTFDVDKARRWIIARIFQLGWKTDLLGNIDERINTHSYYRSEHKPERIGKKYQWIAFHELLAHLTDNYEFSGRYSSNQECYRFPSQLSVRDIDPSSTLEVTLGRDNSNKNSWWHPVAYHILGVHEDLEWLKTKTDLPSIKDCIEVKEPSNGTEWINVNCTLDWDEPVEEGLNRYEVTRRQLFYHVRAFLFHKKDAKILIESQKNLDFDLNDIPETYDRYQIFLGEFYWSSVYKFHNMPYYWLSDWTRGRNDMFPAKILPLTESYISEGNSCDCSIKDTISISLPSQKVAEQMRLKWNGKAYAFYDSENRLVSLDPSIVQLGPKALLFNKSTLMQFLQHNEYEILWIITGEKRRIGMTSGQENYLGRLEIRMMSYTENGHIQYGIENIEFLPPHNK